MTKKKVVSQTDWYLISFSSILRKKGNNVNSFENKVILALSTLPIFSVKGKKRRPAGPMLVTNVGLFTDIAFFYTSFCNVFSLPSRVWFHAIGFFLFFLFLFHFQAVLMWVFRWHFPLFLIQWMNGSLVSPFLVFSIFFDLGISSFLRYDI